MIPRPLATLILSLFSLSLSAHPAWGIVVDQHRNIYFADILHEDRGAVWKLDPQGKLHLLFRNFHAHNVSLDTKGNLVTAHGEDNHTMVRRSPDGRLDTLFHTLDHNVFFGGNCTYSPAGEILFSIENYLWRINKTGHREKISFHKFGWNQSIFADEEGNVYAPDIDDGRGKLIRIDPKGMATVIATDLITHLDNRPYDRHQDVLLGINKDQAGNLYISETAGRRIIRINEQGKSTFYQSEPDWIPCGIDFVGAEAYILESKVDHGYGGPKIIQISADGMKQVLLDFDRYKKEDIIPFTPLINENQNHWLFAVLFTIILFFIFVFAYQRNSTHTSFHI